MSLAVAGKTPLGATIVFVVIYGGYAVLVAVALLDRLRHARRKPPPACPHCGYDMRGDATGRCPECGR